ncbi:MAG: DNA polymerase III subunit beta [Planctomycetota bacterium]|jgi:DNA polymerase-3 subunit beta
MKVIAQTAALSEALQLAGSIVATRTPKPVLQCVKLIAAGDKLTMLATDLEAGARYEITAVQIEEEGEALIPADRLTGIVRESSDEDSLTIETDKEAAIIRGAGSRFKVLGYDPGEYPAVAEFGDKGDFQVPAATLSEMIARTLFATAKAHSHYAISGVLWETSGKKLQLVATDGHRLALAKGSLGKAAAKDITAIVPAKLMSLIQRVAGDEETVEVKVDENQIMARTSRAVLMSSLVQGNFPKYSDVIPKDSPAKAVINTGQLEHRIRQAALLTNEESRGVRLAFATEQATLTSRAPETGEAEVTCPIKFDGDPLEIAFNPSFLLEALRVVATDDITLELSAANKPALLKAGSDFLYVLMPVDLG